MAVRPATRSDRSVKAPQLSRYFAMVKSRWLVICLCVLIGLAAAVLNIARTPKAYVASSQVFVTASLVKDASGLFSANQFAQSRVQTYVAVVASPLIVHGVNQELGLNMSDRQLTGKITADAPLNKTLVNIHVRDGSASRAAEIANAVASRFISVVKDIETNTAATPGVASASVLKLTVIHPATVPSAPIAPQKRFFLLVGFFGGLVVGLFLVVVREWMNNRLRSPLDIEAVSTLPLLGVIPNDRRAKSKPNAFVDHASPRSEAFRVLRTNIEFVGIGGGPKVIAVTSPVGHEGKTAVALNLAVSLSEAGFSVALVETDLRHPILARLLLVNGDVGLTSLLTGSARIDEAVQHVDTGFAVVTSGPLPPNPSELLGTKHLSAVLATLGELFDYLILDAASLLPVADGAEVASVADATVLVVRAGETTTENFRRSITAVSQVGGTIAGVVMNRSYDIDRSIRARGGSVPRGRVDARTDRSRSMDILPEPIDR